MKKKMLTVSLAIGLLLAGCSPDSPEVDSKKGKQSLSGDTVTVMELKQKYGVEKDKGIMPMYNVAPDKKFTFKFNSDLSDLYPGDVISVHGDIKALEESKIFTIVSQEDLMAEKSELVVNPPASPVLESESQKDEAIGTHWGNAPIYYIRINYDLDAETPTKLDKPIIVPFTVKSELQVPNLTHEISEDGRLKLVWDKVEGAEKYNVYQVNSPWNSFEEGNIPINGAEKGYISLYPRLVGTVTETEYNDFMQDGNGGLSMFQEEGINTFQNFGVKGEYYVTAVQGDKESSFSPSVNTPALSDNLPFKIETDISFTTLENPSLLPKTVKVRLVNDKLVDKEVIYHTENVQLNEYGSPVPLYFSIKGTALKSYLQVGNLTENDLQKLSEGNYKNTTNALVEPENNTDYVPSPEVPTVIEDTKEEPKKETEPKEQTASEPTEDLVEKQKENTEKHVEEGNKESIEQPSTVKEVPINANSALEEYLALQMINAETEISLKAFPEAQNFEVLADALQKVYYQNPLILGVSRYGYNYGTLTLMVEYKESSEDIKQKQKEIIKEANKIVSSIIKDGMSDEEKRKAIYDYLNDNTKYDDGALENAEKNNFQKVDDKFNDSFTTYGIMVKKVGVCQSYATTYKMLGDLAGLETIVVTGTMGNVPHAWNKVKIGEEWVHVDSTNNETNSGIPYLLYNSSDTTAEGLDFSTDKGYWLDSELPKFYSTNNSNDYYVVNGLEVSTIDAFKSKVAEGLQSGKDTIVVRYIGQIDNNAIMNATAETYNELAPDKLNSARVASLGNYILISH